MQDICAHPVRYPRFREISEADLAVKRPALVVKAYTLAAKTFADEIQSSVVRMEIGSVSEMTNGLNDCLQGLQALKKTLVMFPEAEYHVVNPAS